MGKVPQFTWKILGRKEMLTVRNGKLDFGWDKGKFYFGNDNYYQRVNTYVLEGRSKDPNYMYSKMVFYVDPTNWLITWEICYDAKGRPWHVENYCWGAGGNWIPEPVMNHIDIQRQYTSHCMITKSQYNNNYKPAFFNLDNLKKVYPVGR